MTNVYSTCAKLALVSSVAVTLAACESSGGYRIASVGQVPESGSSSSSSGGDGTGSSSSGGGTSSSSGGASSSSSGGMSSSGGGASSSSGGASSSGGSSSSGGTGGTGAITPIGTVLVTAGNTVIGVSRTTVALAPGLPAVGTVVGTVSGVLRGTGQTLVNLGQNRSLILNGTGAVVGDLLTIDLGSRRVIGTTGRRGVIGLGVLPVTGGLLNANVGRGNLANGGNGGLVTGVLNTATGTVSGVTGGHATGGTGAASGVVGTVTNTVGGVTGGITHITPTPQPGSIAVGAGAGAGIGATLGGVTAPVTGLLGGHH